MAEPATVVSALRGSDLDTPAIADGAVLASNAVVSTKGDRTIFEMALGRRLPAQVYILTEPNRLVIDLPEVEFDFLDGLSDGGAGLIRSYRYGQLAAGRSRIVADLNGPVRVVRSGVLADGDGLPARLMVELAPAAVSPAWPPAAIKPAVDKGKFVIMIDPGHGGADGGAMSVYRTLEKDIVLAVALKLKVALDSRGRYDVHMTRTTDRFVSLDQRVAMSQAAGADLFISLHADAVNDPAFAQSVHGATVYTLSEQASSQAAQAVADKENAADAAGSPGVGDASIEQVKTILADLTQRETANFSGEFRHLLLQRLRPASVLGHDPARSAGFRVLRQAQTPTVLIELGFVSNPEDAAHLQQAEWQGSVVAAVAAAVDSYAVKRTVAVK